MTESLAQRKEQLIAECRENYAPQRSSWWKRSPDNTYAFTWDIYVKKNYPRVFADEIIIRYNKKEAITAFAVCIGLGIPVYIMMWGEASRLVKIIMACILALVSILFLLQARDQSPKIILNKEGLWTTRWKFFIPWKNMVISCIRTNSSGEDTDYYLRIHYYDEEADEFKIAEYNLGGLEKETDTIACFVQQFRILFGNDRPIRNHQG